MRSGETEDTYLGREYSSLEATGRCYASFKPASSPYNPLRSISVPNVGTDVGFGSFEDRKVVDSKEVFCRGEKTQC